MLIDGHFSVDISCGFLYFDVPLISNQSLPQQLCKLCNFIHFKKGSDQSTNSKVDAEFENIESKRSEHFDDKDFTEKAQKEKV